MLLSDVVLGLNADLRGDAQVLAIAHDSRAVKEGTLFVCLPGTRVDGHDFAAAPAAGEGDRCPHCLCYCGG